MSDHTMRERFAQLVGVARERSRATGRRTLASMVTRIPENDPLRALEIMSMRLPTAEMQDFSTRMFWTRPADRFALAGIGAAATFSPEGADRFATIDREWKTLVADAVSDDASDGAPGAGPLVMGGFAFDPEGPHASVWRDFPAAHLFVPSLQFAQVGRDYWLTTNVLVGDDSPDASELAALLNMRARLLRDVSDRALLSEEPEAPSFSTADVRSAADWRGTVRDAVAAIDGGKLDKVVLAREVCAVEGQDFDVCAALAYLRDAHETSYVFGVWLGESAFIGATPERLVRVDGSRVEASSLAGSASRGRTASDDTRLAASLLSSAKDRAEHEIVRRALLTGLARLCDNVTAADGPTLLTLPNVHHLHTEVFARLRAGHTLLQLVAQLHPTPAVGGEPRNAALRFIREHEKMDRGWYAAPVGWLQRGRGEFAVALRSALVQGAKARLFAGCGIVAGSDADDEYAESLLKLRPMASALSAIRVATEPKLNGTECVAAETGSAGFGGAAS